MTILIILALLALAAIFAVCFVVFKLGWLIFKSHSNKGPLLAAGVCTVVVAAALTLGTWLGVRAVLSPFQGIMARVKQNPSPVYGERIYQDNTFPFELTVFNGMDFSDWIHWGDIDVKFGIDTNIFKKDAAGNTAEDFLMSALLRQTNAASNNPFEYLQAQLLNAQKQRQITLVQYGPTEINGLPAYQAQGEAYTSRGKGNFWLAAVQTEPHTVYYLGAFSLQDTPQAQHQAQRMLTSFKRTN